MNWLTRFAALLTARRKRWGSTAAKEQIWDQEYAAGQWDGMMPTATDSIFGYLDTYIAGGSILDMGCGAGPTGHDLKPTSYAHFHGVDISQVAITRAVARAQEQGRAAKNTYVCGDIACYAPTRQYDVILFRESLYYIPFLRIVSVLNALKPSLTARGAFIVRMHDRKEYLPITTLIQRQYTIIEQSDDTKPNVTLVFR